MRERMRPKDREIKNMEVSGRPSGLLGLEASGGRLSFTYSLN